MRFLYSASSNSIWKGIYCYKNNKVLFSESINSNEFNGIVEGSNQEKYNIYLNINHPKKSTCDCPHAKGRRIVCKHIIALFFKNFPEKLDEFMDEVEKNQKEYDYYLEKRYNKMKQSIQSMKKAELVEILLDILDYSPDWVTEKFIRDYVEDDFE